MGKLVLYGIEISPPVRTVLLTLNALGLDYELQEVNPLQGEHRSEDFIKKNPQHTIPVLEDDGEFFWDSHAISAYLVRKYGKTDELYPKDFYTRAMVDQRLHFDSGVLFTGLRNITGPIVRNNETNIPQIRIDAVCDAYNFLEAFLVNDYLTGNAITIADFSVVSTVTSLEPLVPINPTKNPKVVAWIKRLATLPYYEKANGKGIGLYKELINAKLGKK